MSTKLATSTKPLAESMTLLRSELKTISQAIAIAEQVVRETTTNGWWRLAKIIHEAKEVEGDPRSVYDERLKIAFQESYPGKDANDKELWKKHAGNISKILTVGFDGSPSEWKRWELKHPGWEIAWQEVVDRKKGKDTQKGTDIKGKSWTDPKSGSEEYIAGQSQPGEGPNQPKTGKDAEPKKEVSKHDPVPNFATYVNQNEQHFIKLIDNLADNNLLHVPIVSYTVEKLLLGGNKKMTQALIYELMSKEAFRDAVSDFVIDNPTMFEMVTGIPADDDESAKG